MSIAVQFGGEEVWSRARCIPLNHLLTLTCGVKECPKFNKKSIPKSSNTIPTILQEKVNTAEKTISTIVKEETQLDQAQQKEIKMFYDFSNKRKMECERYQDCSWFLQQSPVGCLKDKLSLAEAVEPIIEFNDFNIAMHNATEQITPGEENYLGIFDDVFLQENEKLEKSSKEEPDTSDMDFNFNLGREETTDPFHPLYGLKKTDSFDNMEYISSTNPAEILPITLMECINSGNSGLTALSLKNNIKREKEDSSTLEKQLPDSSSQIFESNDGSLNIGREEIVEDENGSEVAEQTWKSHDVNLNLYNPPESQPVDKTIKSSTVTFKGKQNNDSATAEDNTKSNEKHPKIKEEQKGNDVFNEKLDFSLDLAKVNFEQSLGVGTPDLDFMDLVQFINEDMSMKNQRTEYKAIAGEVTSTEDEKYSSKENSEDVSSKCNENGQMESNTKTSVTESNKPAATTATETPDENTSIAERIKTKAKRRVAQRHPVIENVTTSEDEDNEDQEGYGEDDYDDEDDEDDDDYEYDEESPKRRCTGSSLKKRTRNFPDSTSVGRKQKDVKEPVDSYRERRDKNNEASRRSRQNRKDRERHMFKTLEEEERRNVKLRAESDLLEKQVTSLRKLLLQVVLRKADGT
ncbi:hypothetical protein RUM44_005128 [Polyplax serrata]|uniref:BZIP domain-containing protein n=1 Tax=Polyplax serrata TaxID=468196 RepID=A0ABR1AE52_POLSC